MTPSIHVVRPGLQTTVQDLGRWGHQSQGVPVAGPMDPFAHRQANALVGNPRTGATLEIALLGPEIEFEEARLVAIAGAEFVVTVNDVLAPRGEPFVVPAGARLRFGARVRGARTYLGIEGGLDVPPVLGSCATHVPGAMGGWHGRALMSGDRLPLGARSRSASPRRKATAVSQPMGTPRVVRFLPGPDEHCFAQDAMEMLQSGPYIVGRESDRMGFRLEGGVLRHRQSADIISDVTPIGTLQVPGSGQPILLMADHQTTGGYPRIGVVITADLGVAAQAAPGDALTFRICTPAEALSALIANERRLMAIETP